MRNLQKTIGLLNTALIVVAGMALLVLMGITVLDVTLGVFGHRIRGSQELVGLAGVIVVACALGQTQERKDHVPVDIITRRFPPALNRAIDVVRYCAKLAFALVVAWAAARYALRLWDSGELTENLRLPFWPFVLVMAGGFAVLAGTVVLDLLQTLAPGWFEQQKPAGATAAAEQSSQLDEEEVPLP